MYELAVEHHGWLYAYLRGVIMTFTEMKECHPEEVAELLGDMATAADAAAHRRGRAFPAGTPMARLQPVARDRLPAQRWLPAAAGVPAVRPGRSSTAEQRTNLVFLYPIGRTHVSRALMEGPTLARELEAQGRPGANLLITRDGEVTQSGAGRPVLQHQQRASLYQPRGVYHRACGGTVASPPRRRRSWPHGMSGRKGCASPRASPRRSPWR